MPDSAAPSSPNLQDPVTLLLINGTTVEQAESFCVTRGMNPTGEGADGAAGCRCIATTPQVFLRRKILFARRPKQ